MADVISEYPWSLIHHQESPMCKQPPNPRSVRGILRALVLTAKKSLLAHISSCGQADQPTDKCHWTEQALGTPGDCTN